MALRAFISICILTCSLFTSNHVIHTHTRPEYLIKVDFSKPSTARRLTVYKDNEPIMASESAHGINSGHGIYSVRFSNEFGSLESSLGRYIIVGRYVGRHGLSLRIKGLDSTNNNAEARYIVIHSAPYIGHGKTGHSDGCFAVPPETMRFILNNVPIGSELIATD